MSTSSGAPGTWQPRVADVAVVCLLALFGVGASVSSAGRLVDPDQPGGGLSLVLGLAVLAAAATVWRLRSGGHWAGWVGVCLVLVASLVPGSDFRGFTLIAALVLSMLVWEHGTRHVRARRTR